jgi:ankyrin repeat protein
MSSHIPPQQNQPAYPIPVGVPPLPPPLPANQPALPPVMRIVQPTNDMRVENTEADSRQERQGTKRKLSESSSYPVIKSVKLESSPMSMLNEQIKQGDADAVRAMLQKYPELLELTDATIPTPLCTAAKAGNGAIVRMLLDEFHANINKLSQYGPTALVCAVQGGHLAIVKELLSRNAEVWKVNPFDGKSVLYWAAEAGTEAMLLTLLKAGANPNQTSSLGETALMKAVEHANISAVCVLLRAKVKTESADINGDTALIHACKKNNQEILNMLLVAGADLEKANLSGRTCLMIACTSGHAAVVKYLLKMGASVDFPHPFHNGDNALHLVCKSGQTEIAQILLECGASSLALNQQRQTPLQVACLAGQVEIVRLLLLHKPPINHLDNSGKTALSIACASNALEMVQLLCSAGADKAMLDRSGRDAGLNALDVALKYKYYGVAEYLIQQGCKMSLLPDNPRIPTLKLSDPICIDLQSHAALIAASTTSAPHGLENSLLLTQPEQFIDSMISQFKQYATWRTWMLDQGFSIFIVNEISKRRQHLVGLLSTLSDTNKVPSVIYSQVMAGILILSVRAESLKAGFGGKGMSAATEAALQGMVQQQCDLLNEASKHTQQRLSITSLISTYVKYISISGEINVPQFREELVTKHGIYVQNVTRLIHLFEAALKKAKAKAADLPSMGRIGHLHARMGSNIIEFLGLNFKILLQEAVNDSTAPPGFREGFERMTSQLAQDDYTDLVFGQWRLICAAHDVVMSASPGNQS